MLAAALDWFLLFPADRFAPWTAIGQRVAAPLSGGLLVAPFINRLACLRGVYAWLRAHPVRFRLWLLLGAWLWRGGCAAAKQLRLLIRIVRIAIHLHRRCHR
jgi:hypothetical protein